MKKLAFILFTLCVTVTTYGQKWEWVEECSSDTIQYKTKQDTNWRKAFRCTVRSTANFRMELGVSGFAYNSPTSNWLPNHKTPNFAFSLGAKNFTLGVNAKPMTVNPQSVLIFDGVALPENADLNVIKTNFFVGYSFDFNWGLSLEPYVGFSKTQFRVINEEEISTTVNLSNSAGAIAGITLNKYLNIGQYEYLSIYGSAGIGTTDYSKTHSSNGKGYSEWTFGVAYKFFAAKTSLKDI